MTAGDVELDNHPGQESEIDTVDRYVVLLDDVHRPVDRALK
jgi:hypothetical protein